jgi:cytoskeletal protein CcmA (bactofilin family)
MLSRVMPQAALAQLKADVQPMFGLKRSKTGDLKMSDAYYDPRSPMNPTRPVGAPASAVRPPPTPELARAADLVRPADSPLRRPSELTDPSKSDGEMRQLSIGRGITLTGDITSCEKLSIEGSVEANLINCHALAIAESGLFKGSTSIEEAEVRGRFEGDLTVRKRLLIRSTGRVSGTVRYGQIEIESGGQISGDIQAQPAGKSEEVGSPHELLKTAR